MTTTLCPSVAAAVVGIVCVYAAALYYCINAGRKCRQSVSRVWWVCSILKTFLTIQNNTDNIPQNTHIICTYRVLDAARVCVFFVHPRNWVHVQKWCRCNMKHELIASATASGIADEHHHHNQQQHFHPAGSENAQKHLKQHSPISQKHQHQQFHHHLDIGATSADAAAHGAAPSTTLAASASIVYDGTTTATVNSSVCSGSSSNSSSVPLPLYPAPVGRRLNWTFREKANNVSTRSDLWSEYILRRLCKYKCKWYYKRVNLSHCREHIVIIKCTENGISSTV